MKFLKARWPRWTALTFLVLFQQALLGFAQRPLPAPEMIPAPTWVRPSGNGAPPVQILVGSPGSAATEPAIEYLDSPSVGILESGECSKKWRFRVLPYLWVPGVHGDVTVRGVTAPVNASIGKVADVLVNDLNFAALGQFEASNGRFGFIFNGSYVNVSPGRQINNLNFSTNLGLTLLDLTATYELPCIADAMRLPCGSRFEVLSGFRFNSLSAGLTATDAAGNSATRSGTEDWFDPIVGCRVRVPLLNCVTAQVRGDVGGFGIGEASEFTWNIEATLEYRCGTHCSLVAGYRWLEFDHRNGAGTNRTGIDVLMSGPMLGFAFDF